VGYFSNGAEGELYRERYCERCVHDQGEAFCPVWEAHLWHNYSQRGDAELEEVLGLLIPRRPRAGASSAREEGGGNGRCRMFLPLAGGEGGAP
jgi:hypothetical protein